MKNCPISFSASILVILYAQFSNSYVIRAINSDSPDYEKFYDELNEEYIHQLNEITTKKNYHLITSDPEWVKQYDEIKESDQIPSLEEKLGETKEIYSESIRRLKCDNPWFWNSFKCVWLDVKYRKISSVTRKNAKIAGILIGIVSVVVGIPLCYITIFICYFRIQVKKQSKMMDKLIKEYMPGSIILPNGEHKEYPPTPQEIQAFINLLRTLSTPV